MSAASEHSKQAFVEVYERAGRRLLVYLARRLHDVVANRMGCSERAARAHVSRGLRRVAQALDQHELSTAVRPIR